MPRFFVDRNDIVSNTAYIKGDDVLHIKKVLRLAPGDAIVVCDGDSVEYDAVVKTLERDSVAADLSNRRPCVTEPPIHITLFQGIPKSDKMDIIIQKSVELGVKAIVPMLTEHTVVRMDSAKDAACKVSRWNRISLEAAKQSNRGMIPHVSPPVAFNKAVELSSSMQFRLMPYEKEFERHLSGYIRKTTGNEAETGSIAVFIGPEGGFSLEEAQYACNSGICLATLGPRTLRTETAGIAALAILMYELGDMR